MSTTEPLALPVAATTAFPRRRDRAGRVLPLLIRYVLVMFVAVTVNFALPRMAPGNVVDYLLPPEVAGSLSSADRQDILRQFELDRGVGRQYVVYLKNLATGDLMVSARYGRPVRDLIAERVGWTVLLVGTSLVIATVIGALLGFRSGWRRGGAKDIGMLAGVLLADATPPFFVGSMLLLLFSVRLGWVPTFGARPWEGARGLALISGVLQRLVLPLVTLVVASIGPVFLIARSAMISEVREDYLLGAQARGLSARQIRRHVQRNALLPVSTVVLLSVGTIVGGATVVETVFSYPGLGRLMYESIVARDYPVIQGAALLLVLSVVAANLLNDLLYPLLDPRVRRSRKASQ